MQALGRRALVLGLLGNVRAVQGNGLGLHGVGSLRGLFVNTYVCTYVCTYVFLGIPLRSVGAVRRCRRFDRALHQVHQRVSQDQTRGEWLACVVRQRAEEAAVHRGVQGEGGHPTGLRQDREKPRIEDISQANVKFILGEFYLINYNFALQIF